MIFSLPICQSSHRYLMFCPAGLKARLITNDLGVIAALTASLLGPY